MRHFFKVFFVDSSMIKLNNHQGFGQLLSEFNASFAHFTFKTSMEVDLQDNRFYTVLKCQFESGGV